jgi:hypothetical protein
MNICDLLDAARANQQITSDNKLGIKLGLGGGVVNQLRHGKHLPGDELVVKLCDLADIPREAGLLWAASWRSKGEPRKIWERLAKQALKNPAPSAPRSEAA